MSVLAPQAPSATHRRHRVPAMMPALDAPHRGVKAEPFRAWIRQLMSDTGLPWRVLARAAGVSSATVFALLRGHDGHPATTLPAADAERLFRLDHRRLAYLRQEPANPQHARMLLWSLAMAGCHNHQLAEFSGLDLLAIRTLMAGEAAWCSRLQLLRTEAACEVWGIDPQVALRDKAPASRFDR